MKTAYLDCFSGISGDMFLSALLDAGFPFEVLKERLRTLSLADYSLVTKKEARNHIYGTRFTVETDCQKQPCRNLDDIREIIRKGELSQSVRERALEIFEQLAVVEGKIHHISPDEVHFHEVGAVDSIIDIIGTLIGVDYLNLSHIFASHVPLGSGFVETDHGTIPVPAPATIELLKGIPVYDSGARFEMVTPTGAVLLKNLVESFGRMPPMRVQTVGYGVGKRKLSENPNLLRILIGERQVEHGFETVIILETNLDDANPEYLGYLMERLFDAGALDVSFGHIQMKKNRPGVQIQVIGLPSQEEMLMGILFKESSSLGIRFQYCQRKVLKRSVDHMESPWGIIQVTKYVHDGDTFYKPEYEICRKIALKYNLPIQEIYNWVLGLNRARVLK